MSWNDLSTFRQGSFKFELSILLHILRDAKRVLAEGNQKALVLHT